MDSGLECGLSRALDLAPPLVPAKSGASFSVPQVMALGFVFPLVEVSFLRGSAW